MSIRLPKVEASASFPVWHLMPALPQVCSTTPHSQQERTRGARLKKSVSWNIDLRLQLT